MANTTPGRGVQRWLSLKAYGLFTSTLFTPQRSPQKMRALFERAGHSSRESLTAKYAALRFDDHETDQLFIESVRAVPEPECVILYLHGGAFFMGSPASYRRRSMKLSYRCRAEVFVPDYRLAPEHPFPAPLEDALRAWDYVRRIRPDAPIFVTGDSAGGGLALSLLVALRDRGGRMPVGAFVFSPWTDHTHSGSSVSDNAGRDLWLGRAHLEAWSRYAVGGSDPADPLLSPVFAQLHGLPPTLLFAGEHELLLDDARRIADAMRAAGGDARLHIGPKMQHDWPLTLPWLEEAERAWLAVVEMVSTLRPARG